MNHQKVLVVIALVCAFMLSSCDKDSPIGIYELKSSALEKYKEYEFATANLRIKQRNLESDYIILSNSVSKLKEDFRRCEMATTQVHQEFWEHIGTRAINH